MDFIPEIATTRLAIRLQLALSVFNLALSSVATVR